MNKTAFAVLAFVLAGIATRAGAQATNSAISPSVPRTAKTRGIEKFMGELYRRGQFNGAVLVADREGVIYRGAFGLANRTTNVAFTPDTPSCLASLSKPLTSLAVMMLAEKGSIKYDDHISDYIRELPPQLGVAKVRQLLSHTSGIPDLQRSERGASWHDTTSRLGKNTGTATPGTCCSVFSLRECRACPCLNTCRRKVFGPLRMTKSFVLTDDKEKTPDVARAYNAFGTADDYQAFVTGDGGVYSTVDEFYLFDRALYTDELAHQSTLAQAFTPASVREGSTTYGFGWNIKEESFGKRV